MFHRLLAIAAAAVLLPTLAASASLATTSTVSGVSVVTGTVATAQGHAAPGVAVRLYSWPSARVLQGLKPGQSVPTRLLATATSGPGGRYALTVPRTVLKAAAIHQGWANLEVDATSGESRLFPYQTRAAVAKRVNLAVANLSGPVCDHPQTGSSTPWTFLRQLDKAWAIVGQGYVKRAKGTKGDWTDFTYKQGQSSTLGIGATASAYDTGYSVTGSNKVWSTADQTFPRQGQNAWFRTMFRVALYRRLCIQDGGTRRHQKGKCPKKYKGADVNYCMWMVLSDGWAGGDSIQHPKHAPSTPSSYCVPETAGSTFSKDHGVAVTWSKGFSIAAATGISFNGKSQTGYDVDGHIEFNFTTTGWLCGTNHDPPAAAQMVARPTRS